MQGRGKFITLEGGEGSGKTTMIGRIGSYFEERGIPYVVTREPGGIEIAEKIRSIILDPLHTAMDARTEALLYAAARSQHLAEKVEPALRAGKAVICDRFVDSSLVYQGYARGLGIENVWAINRFAIGDLMPDVTLYLDIEPEVGLARIDAHDGREVNRLDLENLEFHRKVREGYFLLKEQFPERIRVIDASMKQEDVLAAMILSLETGILKDFDE
ncbi:dTMP kinase [Paenibacillus sp. FSL H7-0942]|uniref:Thymidylate kinase n=1 Tax=Paenibacillus amylolyticus TaxID=1451 RepID=A0A1R1BGJ5_PAEAM|nr:MULTISPECIES: dTMP kinase [Paenibacillus]ETT39706.1 thymidylate kinase [Paenibacillus sp. FSL R5-192]KLU52859.1 thymidylate kinase [Paenibacillus sp. VT-400]MCL6664325.1 dTMP kinase [Paenibacillus amylolyticus]OME98900.1 dTMP kinase [Paenibacillus amylolyticus]OMF06117.1 dTMP kinase [Paenibacillus amylolyticus]